jgi:tetratricopeptide (TPR) repeat protein
MLFYAHRLTLVVACLGLLGAGTAARAQDTQDSQTTPGQLLVPGLSLSPLGSGPKGPRPLPNVELSGEVMFQILASEIAAQRGSFTTATATSLDLARRTRDPRLARRAVEFALASGDVTRALDAAQVWAQLDPYDPEARQTALSLTAAAGHVEGLGGALRTRIATAPDKNAAIVDARRVVGRLPDKKRALEVLDEAYADVNTLPEAHLALARTAALAGDIKRAQSEADAALAAAPNSESAAMLALQIGMESQPERSLAQARTFIEAHPGSRNMRVLLARALATRKDFDGAAAELQAAASANPEDFELVYMQGVLAFQADRADRADSFFAQYLSVSDQRVAAGNPELPEAADALMLRVQIAEDQKRYDDAYALLGKIDDPETQFTAHLRQAMVRAKQGRVDEARKLLSAMDPRDDQEGAAIALTESQVLRAANRKDEAISVLEAAQGRYPGATDVMYDLAMLYEQKDRVADMETLLRKVVALEPDHAQAYNALGYSLADRNLRLPEAKQLVERALTLSPDDPFIVDSMGWVFYRMGDKTQALAYLERAYKLRPDAEIGVHFGEVLWSAGQQDRARNIWRQVQAKEPDNALLLSTLGRFNVKL